MSVQDVTTPSSNNGSSAGSPAPTTPISPQTADNASLPPTNDANATATAVSPTTKGANTNAAATGKRKPSRRANTAERRATHNAVERQRRETLNGRFLDLAALLPNLATVRRPSKSAIVNSSIALVHSHRRQRLQAARELRALKLETDAIRRELNEWRDRAALPRVDEPARSNEFLALISVGDSENEEGNGWWDTDLNEMGEEERRAYELVLRDEEGDEALMEEDEDFVPRGGMAGQKGLPVPVSMPMGGGNNATVNLQLQHILPRNNVAGQQQQQQSARAPFQMRQQGNMQNGHVLSPTSLSFDGGQVGVHTMYESNGGGGGGSLPHGHSHAMPVHPGFAAAYTLGLSNGGDTHGMGMFGVGPTPTQTQTQSQWGHQLPQHGLFTPPGTANSSMCNGGGGPPSPLGVAGVCANPFAGSHAMLTGMQQNSSMSMGLGHGVGHGHGHGVGVGVGLGHGHVYASPEVDDASSVSSAEGNGNGRSGGGSPARSDGYGRKVGGGMGGVGMGIGQPWGATGTAQVGAMMALM